MDDEVQLPAPVSADGSPLAALLGRRRSGREFADEPVTLQAIAQLLWAAQGITADDGRRTAPSAGGLWPLEVLLVAGRVDGAEAGLYRYRPQRHALARVAAGDLRDELADASWGQDFIAKAAAIVVVCAVYGRTTGKYGERGVRYAQMEAGHAAQNLGLMATELRLQTVVIGAFDDADVRRLLGLADDEVPLTLLPVGSAPGA